MAFRLQYQPLVLSRKITTVFRPGNRIYPNWRGYVEGETVSARIIEQCGSDELGLPPVFNAVSVPIRITGLALKPVDWLGPEDFEGSSPDVMDRAGLLAHLLMIYGKPLTVFGNQVTRIRFRYEVGWADALGYNE